MSKNGRFKDKVIVITGASSGIGRATALEFAREGAKTVLVSRSREKLERVAEDIRRFMPDVLVVPTDVSSPEQVRNMVQKVVSQYGGVDVLFNNAGSSFVGRIEDEDFRANAKKMMDADYFGTVNVTSEVLPVMRGQGSGHIMNMSSVVGKKAFPHFGGYSAAMHAISGFTDALRQELRGTGINVSTIHPSLTQTPLLDNVKPEDMPPPFRRLTPIPVETVAKAVLDGVGGFVTKRSASELAAALTNLDSDRQFLTKMGEAARNHVFSKFVLDDVIARYADLLISLKR